MREIIPRRVWIGNARDATDVTGVLENEIAAVVHLAMEEPPTVFPREIIYCRFPLLDGAGNSPAILRTAIHTVSMLIEGKVRMAQKDFGNGSARCCPGPVERNSNVSGRDVIEVMLT